MAGTAHTTLQMAIPGRFLSRASHNFRGITSSSFRHTVNHIQASHNSADPRKQFSKDFLRENSDISECCESHRLSEKFASRASRCNYFELQGWNASTHPIAPVARYHWASVAHAVLETYGTASDYLLSLFFRANTAPKIASTPNHRPLGNVTNANSTSDSISTLLTMKLCSMPTSGGVPGHGGIAR